MSEPVYDVGADHQILALGRNRMVLFESGDRPHVEGGVSELPGEVMISAERSNPESRWTIRCEIEDKNVEPTHANNRPDAMTAMTQMAYNVLGPNPKPTPGAGDGYSTKFPRGLMEAP